jgi:hypothetical protein
LEWLASSGIPDVQQAATFDLPTAFHTTLSSGRLTFSHDDNVPGHLFSWPSRRSEDLFPVILQGSLVPSQWSVDPTIIDRYLSASNKGRRHLRLVTCDFQIRNPKRPLLLDRETCLPYPVRVEPTTITSSCLVSGAGLVAGDPNEAPTPRRMPFSDCVPSSTCSKNGRTTC